VIARGGLKAAAASNAGPMTFKISRGGTLLATISVPKFNWFGRLRYQSSPRPIIGQVPAWFDKTLKVAAARTKAETYTPMGTAGIEVYFPNTGERDDIGIFTGAQGEYARYGNDAALKTMLAQAEASGSIPWHVRDEETGAPVNFDKKPNVGWGNGGSVPQAQTEWTIDTSHQPHLCWLPWVLTRDSYFLEEMQLTATYNAGLYGGHGSSCILAAMPYGDIGQSRAFAWAIEALAMAAEATPATVPSWLLSKAYWKQKLDNNRDFYKASYLNDTKDNTRKVFHSTDSWWYGPGESVPAATYIKLFMDFMQSGVFEVMLRLGFTDWQEIADWKGAMLVSVYGGTSGYNRNKGALYEFQLRPQALKNPDGTLGPAGFAASWKEGWDMNVARVGNPQTYTPDDSIYDGYGRACLKMLAARGYPGAAAAEAWLRDVMTQKGITFAAKWALG
jgi:hypothetical protein